MLCISNSNNKPLSIYLSVRLSGYHHIILLFFLRLSSFYIKSSYQSQQVRQSLNLIMENTETPIQNEESTPIVPSVTEETSQTTTDITPVIIDEQCTTETTPVINGEQSTTEPAPVINNEPSTTEKTSVTESVEEEIVPSTDEQENVTDTNTIVPTTCLSPGRVNIPLKEVNESEKEEPALIPNGTENGISKKRELEQEDESTEETTNDNDERNGLDQTKKIKISEATDTPIMETKESEPNIIINGNTPVEV